MRVVALLANPFRAKYCVAYLTATDGPTTILTGDPDAFAGRDLPSSTRIHRVTPLPEVLPTAKLARTRWSKGALSRLRGGSKWGAWAERKIKRLVWHMRYLDRVTLLVRKRREPSSIEDQTVRQSAVYQDLLAEHGRQPIDRLVVFDVFDLPVAIVFAEDHDLEVLVR